MSVTPGTTGLLSTGALSGFASFRFGSDNARLCHFCLVHEACCSLSAILAEAFPPVVLQMEPLQTGCQSP